MKSHWRKLAALLPVSLESKIYRRYFTAQHTKWQLAGKTNPPSHLTKQELLINLGDKHKINVLVETGTYLGDMVYAMKKHFKQIYTIELSAFFHRKARERFQKDQHIKLFEGDSGTILSIIVNELKEPAIFWLDGHYSGGRTAKGEKECPIFEELGNIFTSKFRNVIVIDDARLFVGKNDYPTIEELRAFIFNNYSRAEVFLQNDAIIVIPL